MIWEELHPIELRMTHKHDLSLIGLEDGANSSLTLAGPRTQLKREVAGKAMMSEGIYWWDILVQNINNFGTQYTFVANKAVTQGDRVLLTLA